MTAYGIEGVKPVFPAAIISKGGANGLHCAALPGLGLGFAMKVVDGSTVPRWPVLTRALETAGLISKATVRAMEQALWTRIETRRGEPAGSLRVEF
jgi:L-asparaginase II